MRTPRRTRNLAAAIAAAAMAVIACSPGTGVPTIGPEGGTATAPDGATIVVPAGALGAQVPIAIELVTSGAPDLPAEVEGSGAVYALTPHGTTFAKPVTVSVPLEPNVAAASRLPDGFGPMLLKTNAAGDWFALSDATITEGKSGPMFTAQTTSFSYLTSATTSRRINSDGLQRTWFFYGVPKHGDDMTLLLGPPEEQEDGPVHPFHRFGPLPAEFEDGFADGEAFANADGNTYWAYLEGPGDDPPDEYAGNQLQYSQFQSFRKEAGDATLKFTITAVWLDGRNFGAVDLIPHECVGSPSCDLQLYGKVDFRASAMSWGRDFHTLLRASGQVVLKSNIPHVDPTEPLWVLETGAPYGTALWDKDNGDFDAELDGREAFAKLNHPITVEVDLSEVAVGDLVTLAFNVAIETLNEVQGETYIAGFFRDPVSLQGAQLEYTGLTPVMELPPEFEEEEAEPCTTAIDPAAGTIQFAASSYDLRELPIGSTYAVVTREGGSQGDVSVRVRSADDTAREGDDYYGVNRVVLFPDGDDSPRWIELPLAVDDVAEPVERFTLRLEDPRGCAGLGAPAVASVNVYDDDTPADPDAGTYTVGGTVSGLVGSGLVLNGFGTREVTVNANGPFVFPQTWAKGVPYDVRVVQQPVSPTQSCSVANGSGYVQDANIIDVVVTCAPPSATNPHLDPGFGDAGKVTGPLSLGADVVELLVQADGKILVLEERALTRFTASGQPDAGFGDGGTVALEFLGTSYDTGAGMALQDDGKIVVVGSSQASAIDDNGQDWVVARYLANGALDTSFGTSGSGVITGDLGSTQGSSNHESLSSVAIQSDGKIAVGGTISRFNLGSDFLVMRLTAAGQLDGSFGSGGVAEGVDIGGNTDIGRVLRIDGSGRVLLAGRVAPSGGSDPDIAIVRYLPSGDIDDSFGDQGVLRDVTATWDEPFALEVLGDGKLIVAGLLNRFTSDGGPIGLLARYTADGGIDNAFGSTGRVLVQGIVSVRDLDRDDDDNYLAVGPAADGGPGDDDFAVVRLTAAAARDASFGDAGLVSADFYGGLDWADLVALQPDGKVLVAGQISNGSTKELGLVRVMP